MALTLGAVWFAWYLRGAQPQEIGRQLAALGGWASILWIPYLLVYVVDAWAWRRSFAEPPAVPFRSLLRIRWCGESVNNLIPTAYVGGEALKVVLLSRLGVPSTTGTTAALVSKTAQTLAQVAFLATGSAAFLTCGAHPPGLKAAMATVMVGGGATVVLLLWWQRRGIFRSLFGLLDRVGIPTHRWDGRRARLLETDRAIATFYQEHPKVFLSSAAWYLAGWFLDSVEIWLTSRLLGMPLSLVQAVAIESFIGVVKVVGMWVPGALGVQESGIVSLVRLAGGAEPLGATYALVRRARELLFAGIGWGMLMAGGGPLKPGKGGDSGPPGSKQA